MVMLLPVVRGDRKMRNENIGIVEDEPEVAGFYRTAFTALGMSVSFIAGTASRRSMPLEIATLSRI